MELTYLAAAALAAAILLAAVALVPVSLRGLTSEPNPAADFAEALRRFDVIHSEELPVCFPAGQSLLLHHGGPTARAYVFIHGTTNSPHQFEEFARLLWSRGHNVLVMRQPRHGLQSRRLSELRHLRAEELRDCADRAVDIAAGLGAEIVACGMSGGAVLTAWMAQYRREVARALLLVPLLALHGFPRFIHEPMVNLLCRIPSIALEDPLEPRRDWVYRGQTTRAVAETLRLGRAVMQAAADAPPATPSIAILTTASDRQVANSGAERLAQRWAHGGADVVRCELARSLHVPHNAIDRADDVHKKQLVYAKMLEMLGEPPEPSFSAAGSILVEAS